MNYAELHCLSNFSFLRGASQPQELVNTAADLAYSAIAITDECSLAGIVRAHQVAKTRGIKLICGAEFFLSDNLHIVLLAPSRDAYSELCHIISKARRYSKKGIYSLSFKELAQRCQHCFIIWLANPNHISVNSQAEQFTNHFHNRLWLGLSLHCPQQASSRYLSHYQLARQYNIPMVACGSVKMHSRQRKPLHDVLTATRHKTTVMKLGTQSLRNSEAYLKPIPVLAKHYPTSLLEESHRLAKRCHFSLEELRYQYPDEVVPPGQNASNFLRSLTEAGARQRWPQGVPETVPPLIEKELTLIAELQYEHYFLTVYDIVQFARSRDILCQGRGSAANSAVCYCLQITEVDPSRGQLLFERFISRERDEPPDIDVDFEHERREEVIQYIYKKYGRDHAALAATVISYRRRSAVRDVGKALDIDPMLLQKLAKNMAWWDQQEAFIERLQESGVSIDSPIIQIFLKLIKEILGFPRHLSQHVGGFVIARAEIATLVPIENATMPDRSIIQWDKEDLEALGLMKIDILALGMLSAIRKSLSYISERRDSPMQLADIPAEDNACYEMLCRADSIGVFQIESRAQMTMLPRLQPRCFYDLVIQIAIVRPGPIQGGMVHPFLRRRQGLEKISYANDAIASVLKRTLGVPIFQEQVIQVSMAAAGFSGGEADQLRRAMASWGRNGDLEFFKEKLICGMLERGYDIDFAERLFSQMKGFGAYGFPESHSASFALLAYASAWIKCHYPAEFYCGLLNSQPMGFYSPSQLTQDAKRHGVIIRPICINHSNWDHQLEHDDSETPVLRLGFRLIKGFSKDASQKLCSPRDDNFYHTMSDFIARSRLNKQSLQCLVQADAFHYFDSHRYQSLWRAYAYETATPLLNVDSDLDEGITIPPPSEQEEVLSDYQQTGLSLRRHPIALVRDNTIFQHCRTAAELREIEHGRLVKIAGLVTCRQRPGTASGVLFLTLEDETGNSNIVVWPAIQQRHRQAILRGSLILVSGSIQKTTQEKAPAVIHIVALKIEDCSDVLAIQARSHDFH